MGSVCGYKPFVPQKLYPLPSLHPVGGLDFIISLFYSSRLQISFLLPSGILCLCNSTFLHIQKLIMVNLTTALKGNTYLSFWTCSSSVPLNLPSVAQAMQVTFTHEILDILYCSHGQSWFSSCVTVPLIQVWPPARYKLELGWWLAVLLSVFPEGENLPGWKDTHTSQLRPGKHLYPLMAGGYAIRLFSTSCWS